MPEAEVVVPIGRIRDAVATLCAGLLRHDPIDGDEWDRAVSTLGRAHAQLGSSTRGRIYATFAASRSDADPASLPAALEALALDLEVPSSVGQPACQQLDLDL